MGSTRTAHSPMHTAAPSRGRAQRPSPRTRTKALSLVQALRICRTARAQRHRAPVRSRALALALAGVLSLCFAATASAGPAVRHLYGWQNPRLVPFDIDAAGQITERSDQGITVTGSFRSFAIGRDAKTIYVSTTGSYYPTAPGGIRVFAVAADGSLSLRQSLPAEAYSLAVAPDGSRLFAQLSSGQVTSFAVLRRRHPRAPRPPSRRSAAGARCPWRSRRTAQRSTSPRIRTSSSSTRSARTARSRPSSRPTSASAAGRISRSLPTAGGSMRSAAIRAASSRSLSRRAVGWRRSAGASRTPAATCTPPIRAVARSTRASIRTRSSNCSVSRTAASRSSARRTSPRAP